MLRIPLALIVLTQVLASQTADVRPAFEKATPLENTAEDSASVSIGDLNGDGKLDLVLAKGRHKPLHDRVLLNDGKGSYTAGNLGTTPDRTYSAAMADLDQDGDLDLVVSNDAPDRKLLYKNNGKGQFTEFGTFGEPAWVTRYVTVADLNADKYPDLVVANRGGNSAVPSFVCLNDRTGHFPACQALPTESATSIAAADFDGDGAIDLFVPHREGGQCLLFWNDGKGAFPTSTKVGSPGTAARMAAAGDLNGDGRLDLAFIEERKKATFVALNLGDRKFGDSVQLPGAARVPYSLALGDLNKDGHLDVVVGYVRSPGSIFFNTAEGRAFQEAVWNDGEGEVYGIVFNDVNGDGWQDIIAARSSAPNAIWLARAPRTSNSR